LSPDNDRRDGHHEDGWVPVAVCEGCDMTIAETGNPDDDGQIKIAKMLVEPLEWAGFVYQGAALVQTALVDSFPFSHRVLIIGIGVFHAFLGIYVRLTKGPLIRGGPWMAIWLTATFAMPIVMALLVTPHTYAQTSSCIQACTYSTPPFLFIGLFPWIFGRMFRRMTFGVFLIVVFCVECFVLIYVADGGINSTSAESVGSAALWMVASYVLGRAVGKLANVVRRTEADARQQKNNQFFDFLHSHIKAGLAAVRFEQPDVVAMLDKIDDLEAVVSNERISTLLLQDQVPLAFLCSERIRTFSGLINIAQTPRSGSRTVPGEVGRLLNRALGDLLKNAVDAHASTIWITLETLGGNLVLSISDDGPGFEDAVLDDPSRSLHRLRQRTRELGGDLERHQRRPHGSQLIMSVPEFPDSRGTRGI
jgi:hypothetical protein